MPSFVTYKVVVGGTILLFKKYPTIYSRGVKPAFKTANRTASSQYFYIQFDHSQQLIAVILLKMSRNCISWELLLEKSSCSNESTSYLCFPLHEQWQEAPTRLLSFLQHNTFCTASTIPATKGCEFNGSPPPQKKGLQLTCLVRTSSLLNQHTLHPNLKIFLNGIDFQIINHGEAHLLRIRSANYLMFQTYWGGFSLGCAQSRSTEFNKKSLIEFNFIDFAGCNWNLTKSEQIHTLTYGLLSRTILDPHWGFVRYYIVQMR